MIRMATIEAKIIYMQLDKIMAEQIISRRKSIDKTELWNETIDTVLEELPA